MIKARQRQRDRVWVVGPSARQRGLSLVELMIAMALGVTLVGAIAALALNTTRTYRHLSQAGEQIENGRYAMMILKENIEHAGFWGVFSPYAAKIALPESRPDPCNQTPENLAGSLFLPVVGWTCPDDLVDQVPGTSALVVRRAEAPTTNLAMDAPAIPATLNTSSTYIQVTPGEYVIGHGCSKSGLTSVDCTSGWGLQGETKNFSLTKPLNSAGQVPLADIRQFYSDLYYVRSWSAAEHDGIPTLVKRSLAKSGATTEPIIEGIENLQLLYGLDVCFPCSSYPGNQCPSYCGTLTQTEQCQDVEFTPPTGDGAPEVYYTANQIQCWKDWSNVVSVRVDVLARTLAPDRQYVDEKSYQVGNLEIAAPRDHFKRRVFSQVVRVANVSGRRE